MKTLNLNTGKTLSRTVLIITAIMISSGIYAQKSLNSFYLNKYTAELFQSTNEIISALNSSKEQKAFYEEDILLEEWMIDLESWANKMDSSRNQAPANNNNRGINEENEVLLENELELEDWMLHADWIQIEYVEEEELTLEAWMMYPKMWNIYACK